MRRLLGPAIIIGLLAAGPAEAGVDPAAGIPYAPNSTEQPQLVPGGVAVVERRGRVLSLNRIDTTTGARSTIFRRRIDRRVPLAGNPPSVATRVEGRRVVVSYASEYSEPGDELVLLPLGAQLLTGSPGGRFAVLHSCALQTHAAPLDVAGSLLVAAERTTCTGDQSDARYDIVARDLASGARTTLLPGVLVAEHGIAVAGPYAAVATGDDYDEQGYTLGVNRLRVVDTRNAAVVTDIPLNERDFVRDVGLLPGGRVAICSEEKVHLASPGATTLTPTEIDCRRLEYLPDGRVVADRSRDISLTDPATGDKRLLVRASNRPPRFDADGERIAWADATCRTWLVHEAPLATVSVDTPRLTCPSTVGATVTVRGRTARTTLSCPNGCAGELGLYRGTDASGRIAETKVDPRPGARTRVTWRLSAKGAARLAGARRIVVGHLIETTEQFRARTRRVKHG